MLRVASCTGNIDTATPVRLSRDDTVDGYRVNAVSPDKTDDGLGAELVDVARCCLTEFVQDRLADERVDVERTL